MIISMVENFFMQYYTVYRSTTRRTYTLLFAFYNAFKWKEYWISHHREPPCASELFSSTKTNLSYNISENISLEEKYIYTE